MRPTASSRTRIALAALAVLLALLGTAGLAGRLLRLELVYPEYFLGWMSVPISCALLVLGAALWWRGRRSPASASLARSEEERVTLAGGAVLAFIVALSALAGFAVASRQLEALARTSLLEPLKGRIDLFRINLELRSTRATLAAGRGYLVEQLAALHRSPGDPAVQARLQAEAEALLAAGMLGVAFHGAHGEPRAAAGTFVDSAQFSLPLELPNAPTLFWDGGFVLHSRIVARSGGEVVGAAVVQQRLPALTESLRAADDFADSAEIIVCGRRTDSLQCVRPQPDPPVFRIADPAPLPVAQALEGRTDVVTERDRGGRFVIAAYGPIGTTGLGMVLQMDTAELYAPLRSVLHVVLLLLAASVAVGVWLLRLRIAPLVRGLAMSEQRLALALEGSQLSLWDYDARADRVYFDERWAGMLGRAPRPGTATPHELMALVHPDDVPALREHVRQVVQGSVSHYDIEHRVKTESGEWRWIRSRGRIVKRDREDRPLRLAGTNADIHQRKLAELQLAHQAGHDPLTGLPNRALFRDRMEGALARGRRSGALMALMYLDIDKFKAVNDTHGHDVGDALIREFARRLTECIRQTDTAARLGGDEFAVILEGLDEPATGRQIAEKIVVAMREEFVLGAVRLAVSTSVGLAYHHGDTAIAADALVKRADEALYRAKAAGRDTYRVADEVAA